MNTQSIESAEAPNEVGDSSILRVPSEAIAPVAKFPAFFAYLRAVALALLASCLFFLGQLRSWTSEQNRYHYFWSQRDAQALILAVALVAAIIFVGWLVVTHSRSRAIRTAAQFTFLLFLVDSVLSGIASIFVGVGFTPKYDVIFWITWGIITILVAIFRRVLWKLVVTVCLLMSPLPWIMLPQIVTWHFWHPAEHEGLKRSSAMHVAATTPAQGPPLVMIVFDEWSYPRTFNGHDIRPKFTHLRDLARCATVFHNALSPGPATFLSLPRILYQTENGRFLPRRGELLWEESGETTPVHARRTIFDSLLHEGYRVRCLGFYHPYEILLGHKGIECRSFPNDPKYSTVSSQVGWFLICNLRFMTDPISRVVWRHLDSYFFSLHWFQLSKRFEEIAFQLIDDIKPGECLFIHWPLPHGPFILDEHGDYVGSFSPCGDRTLGTPNDYHRHLLRLDQIVGIIQSKLKDKGLFEQTMIVLTSDHGWRKDPELQFREEAADFRHVPLVIKHPFQSERKDCYESCFLSRLEMVFSTKTGHCRSFSGE